MHVKAACRTLMKSTPELAIFIFTQRDRTADWLREEAQQREYENGLSSGMKGNEENIPQRNIFASRKL